ncbi:MAG: hypothetical protein INQ03_17240 [Candidatus Heimdallarchaeota archaeon]|nr:hypothetical protein [Candidatus Heimdallarchaeota archaeon]
MSTIIPPEYLEVYKQIPDNEKESFEYSYNKQGIAENEYIKLSNAIAETLNVFSKPNEYWLFMIGKIYFTSAQYKRLHDLRKEDKFKDNSSLKIFEARLLTYKNQFEPAEQLIDDAMKDFDLDMDLTLLDVLHWFESRFSLGLLYTFSRRFEKLQEVIDELVENSSKYKLKKQLGDHYLDCIYYEHILKVTINFHTGKAKEMREEILTILSFIENVQDVWKRGYLYNLYGISNFMLKEMKHGESALKLAYDYFKETRDLRGFTAVGANLGTSYISQGLHALGRQYIENVLDPMVKLENYSFAIAFMLTASKSYENDKDFKNAEKMVNWAIETSQKANLVEPATYSLFSYFFSRFGNLEKSDEYLDVLLKMTNLEDDEKEIDAYAAQWYYSAAAVNALIKGELRTADQLISDGIKLAEKNNNFDVILECSLIKIEISLKRFIIEESDRHMRQALEILNDIGPLLTSMDNPFYFSIFNVIAAYLNLGIENEIEAKISIERAKEISKFDEKGEGDQRLEIQLYENRAEFLNKASEDDVGLAIKDFWLSEEYIKNLYAVEGMRLLKLLQFQKAQMGSGARDAKVKPSMLLIMKPGGIPVFTYKFDESSLLDESLVGGFISALATFSSELFGGSQLSRIEQEGNILLLERTITDNLIVLIVHKETYLMRKQFKKFIQIATETALFEYLNQDILFSEFDPNYLALKELLEATFLI